MNCKGKLRGGKYTEYECRACHRELPEDHFSAERLERWLQNCHYEQILCLQCAPIWETQWWEKRADKHNYTCSGCKKALPRTAYSAEGFADQNAIVCMECDRASVVERKKLEQQKFKCSGPCKRKDLSHHEFTPATLLRKDVKSWLCKACQFPECTLCHLPSEEPVQFGPQEQKTMARKGRAYERHWLCEWCLFPPCGGCGLKRTRETKNSKRKFELWFCQTCWSEKMTKAKQEHPPCSGCGVKKAVLERRMRSVLEDAVEGSTLEKDRHAHRTWRCSACWRKTGSNSA